MEYTKRGQITSLLILAIIVALGAYGIYISKTSTIQSTQTTTPVMQNRIIDQSQIRESVSSCYDTLARMTLFYFGESGSLLPTPQAARIGAPLNLVLLIDKGKKNLNSNPEKSIENIINTALPYCTEIPELGIKGATIKTGSPNTKVYLREKDVVFTSKFPITIEIGGQQTRIDELTTTVPVRLSKILKAAQSIVDNTAVNPDYFNLTLMGSFGMNVTGGTFGPEVSGYLIRDEESRVLPMVPYEFRFAVRT